MPAAQTPDPLRRTVNKRTGAPLRRMTAYKLPPDLVDRASFLVRLPGEPANLTAVVEAALAAYVRSATRRHPEGV